jgi:mRNA interferase RelE/StbE
MAEIRLTAEVAEDYLSLDPSVRLDVRKAFEKLKVDPRAYGEPLGKKAGINLFGFYSIRAGRRLRIIYSIGENDAVMVRAIGRRDAFEAHRSAEARIRSYLDAAIEKANELSEILEQESGRDKAAGEPSK